MVRRVVLFGGLLLMLFAFAWATRYEPIDLSSYGAVIVWDRWLHRSCLVTPAGDFRCGRR